MKQDTDTTRSAQIKKYVIIALSSWTIFVFLIMSLVGVYAEKKSTLQAALHEARTLLFEKQSFQLWVTSYCGTYVAKSQKIPSDRNLEDMGDRSEAIPMSGEPKLINAEDIQRLMERKYRSIPSGRNQFRRVIFLEGGTSDTWQQNAIKAFRGEATDYYETGGSRDNPVLYLSVLMVKNNTCVVQCHTVRNSEFKDKIGAMGISMPYGDLRALQKKNLARWGILLALAWGCGLLVLGLGAKRILFHVRETELFNVDLKGQKNENLRRKIRLEAIFNAMADGIVLTDPERRISMINPGFTKILGYTLDEIKGRQTRVFYAHQDDFNHQGTVRFNSDTPIENPYFDVEYMRKDGSVFLSETIGTKVVGPDGELIGYLGIIRDITERVANRRKIQTNNERLEIMLQLNQKIDASEAEIVRFGLENSIFLTSSKVGYFHFISDDQKDIQLHTWSENVLKNCTIPEKTKYTLAEAGIWADCIRTGMPVIHNDYQKESKRKGYPEGHTHIVRHMSIPLYDHEKIIGIIGVGNKDKPYTDFDAKQVTILAQGVVRLLLRKKEELEKQALQTQLQQASKMEAIGSLAGGIAHDFNNILGIIIGNIDMAMDDIDEENPARESLDRILNAARRARKIIEQILVFSRQAKVELRPVKPCVLVEETLNLLRATVPTTVKIEEHLRTSGLTITADISQFQQLLMNLFVNAVHAMNEKGTITVTTDQANLQEKDIFDADRFSPGPCFCLTVSDTGVGMDDVTMNRIFDPFFTTKKTSEGTGMGLSIARDIVDAHGGLIQVESKPGKGTTFRIYFPLAHFREEDSQVQTPEVEHGNERILFIDDEVMIAEMGAVLLRRLGYSVEAFTSSIQALETFRSAPDTFDLVITDQTMPDLSGSELAVELLKIKPGIPIILCTGFSKKINRSMVREIGIREFLLKPLDTEILSSAIRRVLTGKKENTSG